MNQMNYASIEASKRLVEAGIKMETEKVHAMRIYLYLYPPDWAVITRDEYENGRLRYADAIPAPSMAEVWRELPELIDEYDLTCEKIFNGGMQAGYTTYDVSGLRWKVLLNNTNPTDALIDLLMWVRKEKP